MAAPAQRLDRLGKELVAIVGRAHVLSDEDLKAPYELDWTRRFLGRAACVVRPGTTEEVAAVIRACSNAGTPVVPQGGNTGLVGGAVPRDGEVVVSLTRLRELEPVDPIGGQVSAGAGVTLAALQDHAGQSGFEFPIDHAARDSATLGGAIATNAGGTRVLRYGTTRANVLGLEAVLADGRIVDRMSGLLKDNAGYDWPGLVTGSEGTLAVVTRARMRLVPHLRRRVTAVVAVDGTDAALELFAVLRSRAPSLEAAEIFYADGLELVREHMGAGSVFASDHAAYVLIECAAQYDPTDELSSAVAECTSVADAAVADDPVGRARLWRWREGHSEAINARGIPHKLDVTVPLHAFARFEKEVRTRVVAAAPMAQTILFGHLGDGNMHVNILGADEDDRVDEAVLRLVAELGGSISAEHGVGVAKVKWLSLTRSPEEIEVMTALKRALDPAGLLNPGVLFPPEKVSLE